MALTTEQRAVLDLVITRDLGLEAIAAMTRLSPPDVRGRCRDALTTLGGGDPGADVTALLLGFADAAQERAALVELWSDPEVAVVTARIAAALRAGWEGYQGPQLPPPPRRGVATAGHRRATVAVAALVLAVAALLVVVLRDDEPSGGSPSTVGTTAVPAPVRITLRAPGATTAAGTVTIGSSATFEPYLELALEGVGAPARGRVYLLWADDGRGRGFPIPTPVEQSADGRLRGRTALSPALAPVLAVSRRIELLTVDAARLSALTEAVERIGAAGEGTRFPPRPGTVVLRGTIPAR